MRRWSVLVPFVLAGCGSRDWQILSGSRAATPTAGAAVVLYGVEGAGDPPPSCTKLGTVRAWSHGEKTFPYDPLRSAAAELGGDSVIELKPDETAPRNTPTWIGTVARCR